MFEWKMAKGFIKHIPRSLFYASCSLSIRFPDTIVSTVNNDTHNNPKTFII